MSSTRRSLLTLACVLCWAPEASAQKVLYAIADIGESAGSGVTRWFSPTVSGGGDAVSSAENRATYPHRVATTFSGLGINVYQNSFSGANHATLTLRRCPTPCADPATETVDTALTLTITAGMTGTFFTDPSLTVSIDAGDRIGLRLLTGTEATKTLTLGPSWLVSTPVGGVTYHMGAFANWNVTTGTRYSATIGLGDSSTVEAAESLKMKTGGTITHLQAHNMASRADGNTLLTNRKNTADGNKVITVTSGAAEGDYVSTAGTDTFAADDLLSVKHTTAGTGNASYSWLQSVFASDDDRFEMGAGRLEVVAAAAAVQYFALGDLNNPSTTEANVQTRAPFPMTLTALRAYTRVNTLTGNSTLAIRVNGADAATITIADTSDATWTDPGGITVNVETGDLINFALTPAGAGTSIELNKIMVTAEDASAARNVGALLLGLP